MWVDRNEIHAHEPSLLAVVAAASRAFTSAISAVVRIESGHAISDSARVRRLIAVDAPLDAALARIEMEAPRWKLRRLVYEDGEWLCSLSRQINLPLDIDDGVEARHLNAAHAILDALVEAKKIDGRIGESEKLARSGIYLPTEVATPCDNFR
jgi:hypothetical protein